MMRLRIGADALGGKGPVLVVSPHLDDGAMSCGRLIAGLARRRRVTVATVFAGGPRTRDAPLPEWDRAAGFVDGDDVTAARRAEDRAALAILGARHRWLPFRDSQYGETPRAAAVARYLHRAEFSAWQACDGLVLFPLGLFHSDHRLTREAVIALLRRSQCRATCIAYEDALYRRLPGLRDAAVARLRRAGFAPQRLRVANDAATVQRKSRAIACYRSQLRALATPGRLGHADAFAEERYWRVAQLPPPFKGRAGVGMGEDAPCPPNIPHPPPNLPLEGGGVRM